MKPEGTLRYSALTFLLGAWTFLSVNYAAFLPQLFSSEAEIARSSARLIANGAALGRILTVTTANNANPPAGSVSLLQALTDLQAGDTVRFNIPGDGPHFIETPADGYPLNQPGGTGPSALTFP